MSLKDDIEKWGSPFKEMVTVTKEREPRIVLVVDSGGSETLLTQAFALKEVGRGVVVHASPRAHGGGPVMIHCHPWIEREGLGSFVAWVKTTRAGVVRLIQGSDMVCLAGDSDSFAEDVGHYLPIVHQNGCLWVTGILTSTPLGPLAEIQQLCKLSIDSAHDRFRLFIKRHWTPNSTAEPSVQTC